ncbi:MAG: OmpH family outer membrane protein [Gammaproteobacteria bacterium]|nr:OmpH family outer membrane protein [Gammaproteobacteria bacterium]
MNQRLVSIIFALALICVPVSLLAEVKLGYVNVAVLLDSSPQAKQAKAALEKEFAPKEAELRAGEEKIKALQEAFSKDAMLLSEEQRNRKELDLKSRMREFKNELEATQDDFKTRQRQLMDGIRKEIVEAVSTFAKAEQYDLIVYDGAIYASEAIDVTEAVLKTLSSR